MVAKSEYNPAAAPDTGTFTGLAADLRPAHLALIYGVLSLGALYPLFRVDIVPLVDFANHMARMHVLADIADDPVLQSNYRLAWGLKPNLAIDVLLPPLTRIIPLFDLGRLFVALSMLILVAGTAALHRALHGKVGLWPAVTFLFLYNQVLIMGLLNFLLGLGLCLCAFAAWIALRPRPATMRIPLFTLIAVGLFFTHMLALALYGLLVGAYEISLVMAAPRDLRRAPRDLAAGAAQFVAPAVLLLAALPPPAAEPSIEYGSVASKLHAFWSPVLTYLDNIDALFLVFVVGVGLFALLTRRIRVAANMGLPLALLAIAAIAAPGSTYGRFGAVWGLDVRVFVSLSFFAVAVCRFRVRSTMVGVVLSALALTLFATRLWEVDKDWRAYDAQFAEYRVAARTIEPGAAILQSQAMSGPVAGDPNNFFLTYYYLTALSVIDRGVFLPTFYTDPTKQPVLAARPREHIDTPAGAPVVVTRLRALADPSLFDWYRNDQGHTGESMYAFMWQDKFDYVVVLHSESSDNPVPELLLPEAHGSFFDIYRVVAGGCTGDYPRGCEALRAFQRENAE